MMTHQSVLLSEAVDALAIQPDAAYIDGTFGRGGHSQAILNQLSPEGELLAIDKDDEAISYANALFGDDKRVFIAKGSFKNIKEHLKNLKVTKPVKGILLDLGVSSPQFDNPERGFSFQHEARLDMRMDKTQSLTAETWLNEASVEELSDVFKRFGEEKLAKKIARKIEAVRREGALTTTTQLADLIQSVYPKPLPHKKPKIHPATKCFQAIRLFINDELSDLSTLLDEALDVLAPGGRLVIISFHSLEDRIVKRFMREKEQGDKHYAKLALPDTKRHTLLKRIGKAIKPSEAEVQNNRRARSAIMRVAERT